MLDLWALWLWCGCGGAGRAGRGDTVDDIGYVKVDW